MIARWLALVGAAAALVVSSPLRAQASDAHYPPRQPCALAVSDRLVVPGQAVRVSGVGLPAHSVVDVALDTRPGFDLGSVRTTSDGTFDMVSVLPETLAAGTHRIHVERPSNCTAAATVVGFAVNGVGTTRSAAAPDSAPAAVSTPVRVMQWSGGIAAVIVLYLIVQAGMSGKLVRRRAGR